MDKWHYTVNNKKFTKKIEAIIESKKSNCPIRFKEHSAYDGIDCSKVSEQSWTTLLKKYAFKLRQDHDHLRLWFSGGCDSTLLLDTFIINNIHLDEILLFKCGYKESDFEIDLAIDYLKKIKHLIPNTKINVNVLDKQHYINYYKDTDWIYNQHISTCHSFRDPVYKPKDSSFDDLPGSKIEIIAKEKPNIVLKNNKYYLFFIDKDIAPDWATQATANPIVNFYIDFPELNIKQSHMLKEYVLQNNISMSDYWNNYNIKQFVQNAGGKRLIYNNNFIKKIFLKNKVNINGYDYSYVNNKDLAFAKVLNSDTEIFLAFKNYYHGSLLIEKDFGNYFHNEKFFDDSIGILSKFHCLDKFQTLTVDELYPHGFDPADSN